jgi:hypothetical protein
VSDDWAVYRIITHEATRGQPLSDILEHWTLDTVDTVNEVLNGIDDSNARAAARAAAERAKPRAKAGRK